MMRRPPRSTRTDTLFPYTTLFRSAVIYAARSTFGLSLQAIRDNPRRMRAIGFDVTLHRVTAYFLAGLIAGTGGVLMVWFNGRISPGPIGVDVVIDIRSEERRVGKECVGTCRSRR